MLKELTLKNSKETILFILDNTVLFKIKTVNLPGAKTYLFFDYTYKETKFIGFNSLPVAKTAIKQRYKEYTTKYVNTERTKDDNRS